jgi:hypothetical protein
MIANHSPGSIPNDNTTTYPAPPEVGSSFKACLKFWLAEGLSKESPGSEGMRLFTSKHRNLIHLSSEPSWKEIETFANRMRDARRPSTHNTISAEVIKEISAFERSYHPIAQHRRLYSTDGGHLGLGPQSSQEGDDVWMVHGAHVPFVLRPVAKKPGTFTLVGETYVHGFMNGEMLDCDGTGGEQKIIIQ